MKLPKIALKSLFIVAISVCVATGFTLSINAGTHNTGKYYIIHLKDDQPITCAGESYEGTKYYRCTIAGVLPPKSMTQVLPFANIQPVQKEGSFELIITPKMSSRLVDASKELFNDDELIAPKIADGQSSDATNPAAKPPAKTAFYTLLPQQSTHFTIVIDEAVRKLKPPSGDGINFPITFEHLKRPSVGALDLNKEPLSHQGGSDVGAYMTIKERYDARLYAEALNDAKKAIELYQGSVFTSEFWLYYVRTLERLLDSVSDYPSVMSYSQQIIDAAKAWMRAYGSDRNYPEMLAILMRTYIKNDMKNDAEYALDMLITEHPDSRWTQMAILSYADNMLARGKPDAAIRYYEDVLFGAKDVDIASKASYQLAKAYLDLGRAPVASEYALKIINANTKFINDNQEQILALASSFNAKNDAKTASALYEALFLGLDKRHHLYEQVLLNTAMTLADTDQKRKANEYLTRYKDEFSQSSSIAEVQTRIDRLFFDIGPGDGVDEREYLANLMSAYAGSDIADKAAVRAIALDHANKRYQDALDLGDKFSDLNDENSKILIYDSALNLANEAIANSQCERASSLVKKYNLSVERPLKLFACFERINAYDDALNLAKRHFMDKDLNNRMIWHSGATRIIYKLGLYEDTINAADDTIKLAATVPYSDSGEAIFYRTMSLLKLNRFEEAAQSLEQLSKIRGTNILQAEANAAMAQAASKNSFAAAVAYAKRAIELQEKLQISSFSPEIDFILISSLMQLRQYDEALNPAKTLLERVLSPQNRARALYQLGEIYLNLNDQTAAEPLINECVNSPFDGDWKSLCVQQLKLLKD